MGSTQTTIEDNTLYQNTHTSPARNSEGCEVVDTTQDIKSEPKDDDDLQYDKVDGIETSMEHSPSKIAKPSRYSPLGTIERTSAVGNQFHHIFSLFDKRISNLEAGNKYIVPHLGEIDDRLDSLGCPKAIINTTEKGQDKIYKRKGTFRRLKRGWDITDDEDERDQKVRRKVHRQRGKRHV
ncbi:hypothetical protein K469DRAFT_774563 [Zopfia rhizophila CBS 207.26]|uniref:Uncharacterized protein n=1 Tax=Zopfia rhizophila CBS 207.26 TaxID=1314779 RepID=A0A6A6EVA9_9PEZI|nr:hypothetical protein K469DRAFT_774563 [Zopfia rhizophila CBS 207.26]